MKKTTFTIGKTSTGYDAYAENNEKIVAVTTGTNLAELRTNALQAYNLYLEAKGSPFIDDNQISFEFDLASFFNFHKEISASGLAVRIGMHKSILSEYVNGKRKPSVKQVRKILEGVKQLGKELTEIEIIF